MELNTFRIGSGYCANVLGAGNSDRMSCTRIIFFSKFHATSIASIHFPFVKIFCVINTTNASDLQSLSILPNHSNAYFLIFSFAMVAKLSQYVGKVFFSAMPIDFPANNVLAVLSDS